MRRRPIHGTRNSGSDALAMHLLARSQDVLCVGDGAVRYREDVVDGLDSAPEAFRGLLRGRNLGKLLVRVSEDTSA